MTQHPPGNHNMKFESALESDCQQGMASCFCSMQPKAHASREAQSKSKKSVRQHSGDFIGTWKSLH